MILDFSAACRQVVDAYLSEGLPDGRVITREQIADRMGIQPPRAVHEVQGYQLKLLQAVQNIRQELLEKHSIYLHPDGRGGLIVAPPEDQTDIVMKVGQREMKRTLAYMMRGVSHVRTNAMSDEARRKNSDAQAKLAALSKMHKISR